MKKLHSSFLVFDARWGVEVKSLLLNHSCKNCLTVEFLDLFQFIKLSFTVICKSLGTPDNPKYFYFQIFGCLDQIFQFDSSRMDALIFR